MLRYGRYIYRSTYPRITAYKVRQGMNKEGTAVLWGKNGLTLWGGGGGRHWGGVGGWGQGGAGHGMSTHGTTGNVGMGLHNGTLHHGSTVGIPNTALSH